jgi:hypothetical protein
MKYIVGIMCIIVSILMYLHLDIFEDTQTIFGTVFFILGTIYLGFKKEN